MVVSQKKWVWTSALICLAVPYLARGEKGSKAISPAAAGPCVCAEPRAKRCQTIWQKSVRTISYTYDVEKGELSFDQRTPKIPADSDMCVCIAIKIINNPSQKQHRYILMVDTTQADSASDEGNLNQVFLSLRPVSSVYFIPQSFPSPASNPIINYRIIIKEEGPGGSPNPIPDKNNLSPPFMLPGFAGSIILT